MAEASDVNKTWLTADDIVTILGELIAAQNESYIIGLALGLPEHQVKSIHKQYDEPKERLMHVIIAFLERESRPTWRIIINALKSPAVNLPALARRVERAHYPSIYSSVDQAQLSSSSQEQEHSESTGRRADEQTCSVGSSAQVKMMIDGMEKKFEMLKDVVIKCLEKRNILVKKVARMLTSLSPDDDDRHRLFLESHFEILFKAANHDQLFGTMNFHWNYLDPSLLGNLVRLLELYEVKNELDSYKCDLQEFRMKTPLTLYCQAKKRKRLRLTPEFREIVAEFDWPDTMMMEHAEQFRQEYASHYGLHEFAIMLAQVRPGSTIITWFVPESIVDKLKAKVPRALLMKYLVTTLEVDGEYVYNSCKSTEAGSEGQSAGRSNPENGPPTVTMESEEEVFDEELLVEKPSEDYFCPVLLDLLLQPHLTTCCGKHISWEAATRVQRDGGACPLCKNKKWNAFLDKMFQRKVKSLQVHCRHKESGCKWQGELRDMENHACYCPMRFGPLREDLLYTIEGVMFIRFDSNICQISGPGLKSATANHPTRIVIHLAGSDGRPLPTDLNVTAQLQLVRKARPNDQPCLQVCRKSHSEYELSYTAVSRGQHKLHIQLNDKEINGSPFRVIVYPDPRRLDHPVRTVTGLNHPYGIAFNSHEQMIVSEYNSNRVCIIDCRGNKITTFGSDTMTYPRGVATDDADNIYVSSQHKLQKFTMDGNLLISMGVYGNNEGEFNNPCGIGIFNNELYVCDKDNYRIQVFDLDFNFVRSISSHSKGRVEFFLPFDVKFDTTGNMYVVEFRDSRVQVMDRTGRFIRSLGLENGKGKLRWSAGVHVVDNYVYVSDNDYDRNCILVYETSGKFVTSFGRPGDNEGEFRHPYCIATDFDGFIYVCDYLNDRIQIFQ